MAGPQSLLRVRGILAAEDENQWLRHWREPYLLALSLPWPFFLILVGLVYLGINLLFTGLYLLQPEGLADASNGRIHPADAFFFSAQTLGSFHYGTLHPSSIYTNVVVTAESLSGLLFMALITGLAYARFTRSSARIRFSRLAVVHPYNGAPTLVLRLANERRNNLLDAKLRAFLAVDEVSSEGHCMRRLLPLPLDRDQGIAFLLVWTAMHRIDGASPLHGLAPADLERLNAEVVVAFNGVDEIMERAVHARASWSVEQLVFGSCFIDMLEAVDGDQRIDWSAFDRTRPCPM